MEKQIIDGDSPTPQPTAGAKKVLQVLSSFILQDCVVIMITLPSWQIGIESQKNNIRGRCSNVILLTFNMYLPAGYTFLASDCLPKEKNNHLG